MYSYVLIKDKGDVTPELSKLLPAVNIIGAYESTSSINTEDIKILSVKFSRTGKTTFDKYPNLQYVICRSHGVDHVNLKETKKRGIKVIATSPDKKPCSDWIYNKIETDNVLIFGNGSISKELQKKLNDFKVVNSKTNQFEIDEWISTAKTIVIAVSLTEETKGYFDKQFFDKIKTAVNIISISRGEVFNNEDMLNSIDKINYGHFDILSPKLRETLLETGKISYYNHSAWKTSDEQRYGIEYIQDLKNVIDSCKIKERKWF